MPMFNFIGYRKNYSKTTESLWKYYRDEPYNGELGDKSYSIRGSKSFDYNTSVTGRLEGNNTAKEVKIVVPLILIWVAFLGACFEVSLFRKYTF